jgi:hypothetical protein
VVKWPIFGPKTLANFLDRKTQFYEQGADARRIGQYVRCLWRWVRAGVENLIIVDLDMDKKKNFVFRGMIVNRDSHTT